MVPPLFLANGTCHPQIAVIGGKKNCIDQKKSADIGPDDLNTVDGRNPAPPGIYIYIYIYITLQIGDKLPTSTA